MSGVTQHWKNFENFRPSKTMAAWACAACVVAAIVVGFNWGGWVTGSTATTMAIQASDEGKAQMMAAICVNRFQTGTDVAVQMDALKKVESYQRAGFIDKGGWAKVPGSNDIVVGAADLCAQKIFATTAALPAVTPPG